MTTSCLHNKNHNVDAKIACFEDCMAGFMVEIKITCTDCGKAFQFLGLEPGLDLQGARVSLDGLEASLAICPEGTKPSPMQRMSLGIKKFDG